MRCFAITKDKRLCKNTARFMFCQKHVWQPLSGLALLISVIGLWAGIFQDIVKPVKETLAKKAALRKPISVEIKSNRRSVPEWLKNQNPSMGEPDIVTILLDRQPVKTIEIFHMAKDQRFKDYPGTQPLTEVRIPTFVEYQLIDLDNDDIPEIVLTIKNQIYSLHYDQLINVVILSPSGEIIARTPYPSKINGFDVDVHNPYSAYRTTGIMHDAASNISLPTTFANGFQISEQDGKRILHFSWVIDNATFPEPHLHQMENFILLDGKLERLGRAPSLSISDEWEAPWSGGKVTNIQEAKAFLAQYNQPTFAETVKQIDEFLSKSGIAKPNPALQGKQRDKAVPRP